MRDDDFTRDIRIVQFTSVSRGTHWVCYIDKYYFDSHMDVAPPENIKLLYKK